MYREIEEDQTLGNKTVFFFVVCFVFTQITFQTGTKSTILVKNSFLLFFSLFLLAKEDTFIVLFTHTHTTTIKMNSQQTLDGMEKKKKKMTQLLNFHKDTMGFYKPCDGIESAKLV